MQKESHQMFLIKQPIQLQAERSSRSGLVTEFLGRNVLGWLDFH